MNKSAKTLGPSPAHAIEIDEASLAAYPDPKFRRFLAYWRALAAGSGAYPRRSAIDPVGLGAELLPGIFLADIVNGDRIRYRYRLLGEAIVQHEKTRSGSYLDEIAAEGVGAIERHYEAVAAGRIFIRRSNLGWHKQPFDFQYYSVLALPLSDDGKAVTHLIGLCVYDR